VEKKNTKHKQLAWVQNKLCHSWFMLCFCFGVGIWDMGWDGPPHFSLTT